MRQPAVLTDKEIELLRRGKIDPNLITDYFFRPKNGVTKIDPETGRPILGGFRFDERFDDEGKWQIEFFFSTQRDKICSGGVGSGKTLAAGVAACVFGMLTAPNFKFMNVAPTAYQARQMYQKILDLAQGTRFEDVIWRAPNSPYMVIELRFKIGNRLVVSTLEFMSIDKNAKNIFSFEGDWIHIDEAAMIDNLDDVIISLGSRTRGSFRGRERLGWLTMTSNPWENNAFWYRFDLAQGDPDHYLSMVVSTRHNRNITPEQLETIMNRIPPDERDRFLNGTRPEGKGSFFSREAIYACEDDSYGQIVASLAEDRIPGYDLHRKPGVGVDYFRVPPVVPNPDEGQTGGIYMVIGDPGTGHAPDRNAPAIGVWRVDGFPDNRCELVSLWWGDGGESIAPFTVQLLQYIQDYQPLISAVDSTATQKNTAEMLNELLKVGRRGDGTTVVFGRSFNLPPNLRIAGLDFSGSKKNSYLIVLQFLLQAKLFRWPKFLNGLRSQLANYEPALDQGTKGKIPQDLVSMMSMTAFVVRRYFYVDPETSRSDSLEALAGLAQHQRTRLRLDRSARSRRTGEAKPTR